MANLEITQLGNPILRQKAQPVAEEQLKTKEFKTLMKNLKSALVNEDGHGLAAPQINQSVRIIAALLNPNLSKKTKDQIAPQVLVNPQIVSYGEEIVEDWEGCLSLNFLRGLVPRYRQITVEALDEKGEKFTIETFDLPARILQHEIDHLDGILYIDRMTDMKSLMSTEEFQKQFSALEQPPEALV